MAERAKNVYRANISYGSIPKRSGHWLDRLPGIDADIAAMSMRIERNNVGANSLHSDAKMAESSVNRQSATMAETSHIPPERFKPGEPLALRLIVSRAERLRSLRGVRLHYRHVDQAERWNAVDAVGNVGVYTVTIPAAYTQSKFALEYYFELEGDRGVKWIYPGFNRGLSNQPYFAVCKRVG